MNRTSTCKSRVEILFQALKETSFDLKIQVSITSNVKQTFDWCSDKSKRFTGRGQVFCLCCRVNHEAGCCIFPISKVFPEDPSSQSTWLLANKPLRKVAENPIQQKAWLDNAFKENTLSLYLQVRRKSKVQFSALLNTVYFSFSEKARITNSFLCHS